MTVAAGIKSCEGLRLTTQRAADDFHVVFMAEISSESRRWRQMLEILGEDLSSATAAFPMFKTVEVELQNVVGPVDEPESAAGLLRKSDDMSPEELPVRSQVQENVGNALCALPALRIKMPDHLPEGGQLLECDDAIFLPRIARSASQAATLRASSFG